MTIPTTDTQEQVILVDEHDREVGLMDKFAAHVGPHLHRAFSIFVFNTNGDMLLQRRAFSKYHSPGLWTNTCCSHPHADETLGQATSRRLQEEMGLSCDLHEVFSFIYKAPVGQGLTEHEFDHVFIGISNTQPAINPEEVEEWKYMSPDAVSEDIRQHPELYTEWFKISFDEIARHAAELRQ